MHLLGHTRAKQFVQFPHPRLDQQTHLRVVAQNLLHDAGFVCPLSRRHRLGQGTLAQLLDQLEESALVDGCTRWEVLWKVVLPMARSGLFATAVFTFIFAWNDFLFALVLTRTEVTTYTVQVTHYFGGQSNFWAKIAAMSVLGTIPVFFTVAVMQRYLVRGLTMGAVKG